MNNYNRNTLCHSIFDYQVFLGAMVVTRCVPIMVNLKGLK